MKTILIFTLASSLAVSQIDPRTNDAPILIVQRADGPHAEDKFHWEGQCQVRCENGECRSVCTSVIVFARTLREAQIKARADFEVEAGTRGQIVSGTVKVEFRF